MGGQLYRKQKVIEMSCISAGDHRPGQMSEAFPTVALLSISGGFQDAYTYLAREHVFANAQTGNVVLLSANAVSGNWEGLLRYLVPLVFFSLGVAVAELIWGHYRERGRLHWRQRVILLEILLLFLSGLLPPEQNVLANSIVSFSCAMQVQTFRKVNGQAFASTMCIGNLRSGIDLLCVFFREREPLVLRQAGTYFSIILLFALGAGIGGAVIPYWGLLSIWASCGLLTVSFLLMLPD